jgi:nicotinamidase/pyrazinamidase
MAAMLPSDSALIVVDVQNDFLPGGSLAVPHGDRVIPPLNRYLAAFAVRRLPIFATRDWHPQDHCSFREHGGLWPTHCVQGSWGGQFAEDLKLPEATTVIAKGTRSDRDAYSGFEGTDLHARLQALGSCQLYVGGLATDYCVLATVRDALAYGYQTYLLGDALAAVELAEGDGRRAIDRMVRLGAELMWWQKVA